MSAATEAAGLMMPDEVARRFGVSAKTIARWAKEGRLPHVRTLGGHRRYRRSDIEAKLAELGMGEAI